MARGRKKGAAAAAAAADAPAEEPPKKKVSFGKTEALFDDGSDEEEEALTINKEYASKFDKEKQRKELESLGSKEVAWGDDDSSEDTVEDDNGMLLNDDRDAAILEATIALRQGKKDVAAAHIQKVNAEVKEDLDKMLQDSDEERPFTMRDQLQQSLLQRGAEGAAFAEEAEDRAVDARWQEREDPEGAAVAASAFKAAVEEEEAGGGLDIIRKKRTAADAERDDKEYGEFLQSSEGRRKQKERSAAERMAALFADVDPTDKREQFLKDFFLGHGWQMSLDERETTAEDVDRVVRQGKQEDMLDDAQAEFEQQYDEQKYRHEEQDAGAIESYPRAHLIKDSLRQEKSVRKEARERKKQRLAEAKVKRDEEVKRLKFLRRKEMDKKVQDLQAIAGLPAENLFDVAQLDEDFDPDTWDKKMSELFNDDYYGHDDTGFEPDDDWENWDDEAGAVAQPDSRQPDADGDDGEAEAREWAAAKAAPEAGSELSAEQLKEMRRRKRKLLKAREEEVDRAMEEYHKLDYEDVIDGQKVRFKYKTVPKETFGLSHDDLLEIDDRTLNQIAPLKFYAPYRSKKDHFRDRQIVQANRRTVRIPKQARPSKKYRTGMEPVQIIEGVGAVLQGVDETAAEGRKARRRRKREEAEAAAAEAAAATEAAVPASGGEPPAKRRRKKRREAA
eukprot:TRINITY_DN2337_c0_g1_i1.p1 TRINITY_DN2337_c0_g1~~TRINITY_DN2337_c0_g1_i1.p1  ORF type:complete len:694 (+),score=349.19 TRINITY_DN2337_c0_g1_i1:59-2083(+)